MNTLSAEVATEALLEPIVLALETRVVESQGVLFDASLKGQRVPEARLRILKARLEGQIRTEVHNTGRLPLLRASLEAWRESLEGHGIVESSRSLGVVRRGAKSTLEEAWVLTGPLDVLWGLVQILFTGRVKVRERAQISSLGFKKDWDATLVVPVDEVRVSWT